MNADNCPQLRRWYQRSQDWTGHEFEHELSALYDCATIFRLML